MSNIAVVGAGAFGTALAIALARAGNEVVLWARSRDLAGDMARHRQNPRYLPGIALPDKLIPTSEASALSGAETVLLCVPTQSLRDFLSQSAPMDTATYVLCCKGIERDTGLLPTGIVEDICPTAQTAVLTGPGFANDIAKGLPTALTFAATLGTASLLQTQLSTPDLRLYLSDDPIGAQLGGALKNVVAIASGIAIGAGLGESARAALMTRGYAEMMRLATDMGANPATLAGLSGFGDLALTCTSAQSRNYTQGLALGQGKGRTEGVTIEGAATARATLTLAEPRGIEMPIAAIVAAVLDRAITINEAVEALMSRPLTKE